MPKKAPKNAFYFFMLDFKQQQQKKGINYDNLAEVAKAADPEWRNASTGLRMKYEDIAKNARRDRNRGEKYTSTGIPLSAVEQQQRELQEAIEAEKQDIRNCIMLKAFNNKDILKEYFYIMDVNYYCKTDTKYLIGESTILRFNLEDGFIDFYHVDINPAAIPLGYASDVKLGCEELGLDMPDDSKPASNYVTIMANIIDYLQRGQSGNALPPLYTIPEKVAPIQDFIQQMCELTTEDELLFRVYRLDTLFFTLINAIKTQKADGYPQESLALLQLKKDLFQYTPGLGCARHEAIDKSTQCTTSRTKRWAYSIMDSCCPAVGIAIKPGLHVPHDYDIDGILSYKEQKKERAAPTVAGFMPASSSCNSTLNDSFKDTSQANSSYVSEKPRKEKRTHVPLRMPQADYSKDIRPAPELTEDNFPALSVGVGRGRGITRSLNNMNIRK